MPEFNEAIEKTYRDYLAQVADLDPAKIAEPLGAEMADQGLHLPLLGNRYIVSANGVSDPAGQRPSHSVSVVLCKYLILCPPYEPRQKDWITGIDRKSSPTATAIFPSFFRCRVATSRSRLP